MSLNPLKFNMSKINLVLFSKPCLLAVVCSQEVMERTIHLLTNTRISFCDSLFLTTRILSSSNPGNIVVKHLSYPSIFFHLNNYKLSSRDHNFFLDFLQQHITWSYVLLLFNCYDHLIYSPSYRHVQMGDIF